MSTPQSPLDVIMQSAAMGPQPVARNSRYSGLPTLSITGPDGRPVAYLSRRFVPQPADLAVLGQHTVAAGERLDLIAAQVFGDAELYWRLCDANNVIRPDELTEKLGRKLRVTLPAGVPSGTRRL